MPKNCRTQYQNILFTLKTRKIQLIDNQDKGQQNIEKELDLINLENLLEYIQQFIYLFKKKKLKKLLEK